MLDSPANRGALHDQRRASCTATTGTSSALWIDASHVVTTVIDCLLLRMCANSPVPQKVQAQLGRIKLLADLDQYDSARLELREGAALGLRRDLRGAEEDYIAIKGEAGPITDHRFAWLFSCCSAWVGP